MISTKKTGAFTITISFGLSVALVCKLANAQPVPASCMDTAKNQRELTECAVSLVGIADAELNKAYHGVMCHLDPQEAALLTSSQRAWIKFRDADCGFWGDSSGTVAPMNAALCVAKLSRTRAIELNEWPPNVRRDQLTTQCK